ncbi:hypothetical protein DL96DRAFT_176307 [Flagelloscypha sp. PMI_526]|nr:hypothetical protein DL96DRAFT_176307 [Flagelloscypha sp. PMI_526]
MGARTRRELISALTFHFQTSMFKRVERRQRRKAKEEELGLDEDTKEFLGLQDTDSDESNSSEEDSSGDEQDAFQSDQNAEVSDDDGVINHQDLSKYAGMDEEQDIPAVTVEQALHDPVFTHLSNPDWSCCILCPGKVLKGKEPAKIHIESHVRFFSSFPLTWVIYLLLTRGWLW